MELRIKTVSELKTTFNKINNIADPVIIVIESGEYEVDSTININRNDVSIVGAGNVVLKGSRRIDLSSCPKEGNFVVVDLKKYGVKDVGSFGLGPYKEFWQVYDIPKPQLTEFGPGLELFFDGARMPISRYPEDDFIRLKKVLSDNSVIKSTDGADLCAKGMFTCNDESVTTWKNYNNTLLVGFWYYDWATQRHLIENIDPQTGMITVNAPYHTFGYRSEDETSYMDKTGGGMFYAVNLIEGVTKPGNWYIDRESFKLYIYPYPGQTYVEVSCVDDMFASNNHANISISNIEIANCRKSGVFFESCNDVKINNVKVHSVGAWGIIVNETMRSTVNECTVYGVGGGGIALNGGDRQQLVSSESVIQKCVVSDVGVWHKTYMAGIDIFGVGVTVSQNLVHDVPSMGILYAGNNHIIEKNELCNTCKLSNDAGAIYSGRNWTFRGNVIRYNYLHDLYGMQNHGCIGLYFDDAVSSAEVYGNIFANIPFIAIELGGGRDYSIYDNYFYNCQVSILYDRRASLWDMFKGNGGRLAERLDEIDYRTDVWKNAYPKLYTIQDDDKLMPMGNAIYNNTIVGGAGIGLFDKLIEDITDFHDNKYIPSELCSSNNPNHSDWYYLSL